MFYRIQSTNVSSLFREIWFSIMYCCCSLQESYARREAHIYHMKHCQIDYAIFWGHTRIFFVALTGRWGAYFLFEGCLVRFQCFFCSIKFVCFNTLGHLKNRYWCSQQSAGAPLFFYAARNFENENRCIFLKVTFYLFTGGALEKWGTRAGILLAVHQLHCLVPGRCFWHQPTNFLMATLIDSVPFLGMRLIPPIFPKRTRSQETKKTMQPPRRVVSFIFCPGFDCCSACAGRKLIAEVRWQMLRSHAA